MATYDEWGNVVSDLPQSEPGASVGGESNFGAALWAFFHPFKVQEEYVTAGQPVPPIQDIQAGAIADMQTHVESGVQDMIRTGKWVALGVAIVAAAVLYREITKGR